MDFTYQGIKYYVHWWYKDYYKSAFYVYYKDGELVYIDYKENRKKGKESKKKQG